MTFLKVKPFQVSFTWCVVLPAKHGVESIGRIILHVIHFLFATLNIDVGVSL